MKLNVAIIIPCFNESDSVLNLRDEIRSLPEIKNINLVPVFINDCSTDNTIDKIKQSGSNYLDLPVNLGIGGAVQTGFIYAANNNFDAAIQLDGDGQHPANEIEKLLQPIINNEADVVIGSRFIEKTGFQSTFSRRMGINYFKFLNKLLLNILITDNTSGFRALNKKALSLVSNHYPDVYPEPEAIVLFKLSNLKIKEVPVQMRERMSGESSIKSFNNLYYMIKVTLGILFMYFRLKINGEHYTIPDTNT